MNQRRNRVMNAALGLFALSLCPAAIAQPGVVRGGQQQVVERLTDDTLEIARSLTEDEKLQGGYRNQVRITGEGGAEMTGAARDIVLKGLAGYGVHDKTVFTEKNGNSLYLFNSSDITRLQPSQRSLRTGGIVSSEGSDPRKFIVFLSSADRKRLGIASEKLIGTFKPTVQPLSDERLKLARTACKDENIKGGYQESVELTGVSSPDQRNVVIAVLSDYDVPNRTVLTDTSGNDLHRFEGNDLRACASVK